MVMVRRSHQKHTLLCIILLRQATLAVRGQIPILCFTFTVLIGSKMLKMMSRLDRFWVSTLRFGSVCVLAAGSF